MAILAVLAGLLAILLLLDAAVLGVTSAYITTIIEQYSGPPIPATIIEAVVAILAVIAAIIGILYVVGYGMWIGAGWAWILAIILLFLDIIIGIVSLPGGIIIIIISALILWYLFQHHVNAFFGRAPASAPLPAPPA